MAKSKGKTGGPMIPGKSGKPKGTMSNKKANGSSKAAKGGMKGGKKGMC